MLPLLLLGGITFLVLRVAERFHLWWRRRTQQTSPLDRRKHRLERDIRAAETIGTQG